MDAVDRETLAAMRAEHIGRLLQRSARAYSDRALVKLEEAGYGGLSLFHTALISHMDLEGTRITTLAERAGITKQAMGQVVAELEARGLVTREPDPDDKRAAIIKFTPEGWHFLEAAYHAKVAIEAEYAALLGENGLETLKALLQKLIEGQ